MINKPTTLILGAGASADYGFPVGKKLIEDIISFYSSNPYYKKLIALFLALNNINEFLPPDKLRYIGEEILNLESDSVTLVKPDIKFVDEFIEALSKAHRASIDDFLYSREEYQLIGKLSILFVLSGYEKRFSLKENNYWYSYLWQRLTNGSGKKIDGLLHNNISIITFNYERSLEHFLINAAVNTFGISLEQASEVINQIPIYHAYGMLGKLPWQNHACEIYPFGEKIETGDHLGLVQSFDRNKPFQSVITEKIFSKCKHILSIAKTIKTYHENNDSVNYLSILRKANKIYFLGFGYIHQNMELLGLAKKFVKKPRGYIYGTTYGMGLASIEQIQKYFETFWSLFPTDIHAIWRHKISSNTRALNISEYFEEVGPLE
jgi:hypothetical protein